MTINHISVNMQSRVDENQKTPYFDTKFCAQCLEDLPNLKKVTAYCKQCKDYICSNWCLKQHGKYRVTKKHEYLQHGELKIFLRRSCDMYSPRGAADDIDSESDDDTLKAPPRLNAIMKTEYNIRDTCDKEICSIHATAVLGNGRVVLADLKNSNLKLFDPRQRACLSVFKLEHGTRDICASNKSKNDVYAVESGVLGIHHLKTGDDIELLNTISTDRECFGITCWTDGIAVVVSSDFPSRGKYELRLVNYMGRVMKKITTNKSVGLEFNLPWYLCSNKAGDRLYISDFGKNSVTSMDLNGSVLSIYKDGDLIRPVSMTTNGDEDIFVVGQRSHNIHHLSSELDKKGVVYSEEMLDFPGGLAYDGNNDVFYIQCTGWSDRLQQFVFTFRSSEDKGD